MLAEEHIRSIFRDGRVVEVSREAIQAGPAGHCCCMGSCGGTALVPQISNALWQVLPGTGAYDLILEAGGRPLLDVLSWSAPRRKVGELLAFLEYCSRKSIANCLEKSKSKRFRKK